MLLLLLVGCAAPNYAYVVPDFSPRDLGEIALTANGEFEADVARLLEASFVERGHSIVLVDAGGEIPVSASTICYYSPIYDWSGGMLTELSLELVEAKSGLLLAKSHAEIGTISFGSPKTQLVTRAMSGLFPEDGAAGEK